MFLGGQCLGLNDDVSFDDYRSKAMKKTTNTDTKEGNEKSVRRISSNNSLLNGNLSFPLTVRQKSAQSMITRL
jgi:hypothetical protein